MEGAKACSKCGEVKPLSDFRRRATSRDGVRADCKSCCRQRDKIFRDSKVGGQADQLSRMISNSKRRAKKKGLPHNIDVAYLHSIVPSYCPYLGVELRWELSHGLTPNSPSLDRIDSSKGYVKGNVTIVSHRANSIKRDATEVELIEMGRRIAQLKMQLAIDEE